MRAACSCAPFRFFRSPAPTADASRRRFAQHGNFDNAPYFYREGKIFTGLIVIEYLLADEGPGDGGIAGASTDPGHRPTFYDCILSR